MDRNLERINKAVDDKLITPEQGQDLTEKVIASGTGKGAANKPAPSATPAVKKAIERASSSESGSVKVSRASGSVEITTGTGGAIDFDVTPLPPSVKQPTPNTCWAAGGTMLMAWKKGAALTVETAMDAAGGSWRSNLDADHALTVNEVKSFAKAIDMSGESPMCYLPSGLLRLLKAHGPLWVIGDDAVENNKMAHVRVVVGMHGDGTSDGTQVKYVDPADGLIHNESYSEFAKHLEASDASSLNLGIYHY
nr:papain-like cysteine protease family protein [Rhizomicrobium palustre]